MHYASSLKTAQHLLEREEFHASIREVSSIFEEGLREFISRLEKAITSHSEKEYFQKLKRRSGRNAPTKLFI